MFVWTIYDLMSVFALCAVVMVWLATAAKSWIKQAMCKHRGDIRETLACDAICSDCGKNLGFIGVVRKARSEQANGGEQ